MGKINWSRVILGGLVAGVIIDIVEGLVNGVVFKNDWAANMATLGKAGWEPSVKQLIAFNVWGLALGVLMVFTYAAIRTRFGPSAQTGMCAGALVWILSAAMPNSFQVFLHLAPLGLMLSVTAIALVEMLIAGAVGAALYKEDGAAKAMNARA
jgi:hypothetical protein